MCLAVPARIIECLGDDMAIVEIDGIRNEISTALLDEVSVGDYVIVHVGFAINHLDVAEAERTLAALAELTDAGRLGVDPHALRD